MFIIKILEVTANINIINFKNLFKTNKIVYCIYFSFIDKTGIIVVVVFI